MQPQPPPDSSAAPPLGSAVRFRGNRWWLWMLAGLVATVLVILGLRQILSVQRNYAATSEALRNARSLSFALFEFEAAYGKTPDASTIEVVRADAGNSVPLGTASSNDFFRQLIASGIVKIETIFFAAVAGSKTPDNRIDGAHALEKGECGFAYMVGVSSRDRTKPLLVTPLIPGTRLFDPKPFNGYACIIFPSGDGLAIPINANGEAIDASGKNILDPANPIWQGTPPVIAWPE